MRLAHQVIKELRAIHSPQYPLYEKILNHAFKINKPLFSEDKFSLKYADLSNNDEWFANSLIANSCLEGYGSQQIWNFSNMLDNDEYARRVRRHSLDESKHSTMFISALKLTFPNVLDHVDEQTKIKIDEMQPKYSSAHHPEIEKVPYEERLFEVESINQLVQVHITEIRALVLQYMVREAFIKHAPEHNRQKLMNISDILIRDEARHINYSADIFEHYASITGNKDYFYQIFEDRLRDFNLLTQEEIDREEIEL